MKLKNKYKLEIMNTHLAFAVYIYFTKVILIIKPLYLNKFEAV